MAQGKRGQARPGRASAAEVIQVLRGLSDWCAAMLPEPGRQARILRATEMSDLRLTLMRAHELIGAAYAPADTTDMLSAIGRVMREGA